MRYYLLLYLLLLSGWVWAQEEREPLREGVPAPQKPAVQSHTLQGTVRDAATGEPLPGAYIKVKGTLAGTVSDAEGRFRLTVLGTPPFTLEVSYVGYETAQVQASGGGALEVQLKEGGLTM